MNTLVQTVKGGECLLSSCCYRMQPWKFAYSTVPVQLAVPFYILQYCESLMIMVRSSDELARLRWSFSFWLITTCYLLNSRSGIKSENLSAVCLKTSVPLNFTATTSWLAAARLLVKVDNYNLNHQISSLIHLLFMLDWYECQLTVRHLVLISYLKW